MLLNYQREIDENLEAQLIAFMEKNRMQSQDPNFFINKLVNDFIESLTRQNQFAKLKEYTTSQLTEMITDYQNKEIKA